VVCFDVRRKESQMAKPTHEDAVVMLQLVHSWPVEASDWIWSDEFTPDYAEYSASNPDGGPAFANVRAILNWYETIGTLHKHGLISEELLFDWLAIDAVWERMKSYALAWREEMGEARMYENFEAMAKAQRDFAAARA
jgi:hypothetical protein